jgi:hypothetical protein
MEEKIRVVLRERPGEEGVESVWEYGREKMDRDKGRMSLKKDKGEEYRKGHKVSLKDIENHKVSRVYL